VAQPFDVTVELAGADLQVSDVRVSAPLEDCASLGLVERLGCRARNAGRETAAHAFAAGLRQEYRGRLVRQIIGRQPLAFDLAGRRFTVQGEITRLGATDASLRADAAATVEVAAARE
jgi:hypothetical protein